MLVYKRVISFLFFFSVFSYSQNLQIDSLCNQGFAVLDNNVQEAKNLGEQVLSQSKIANYEYGENNALLLLGIVALRESDYHNAVEKLTKSKIYFKKHNYIQELAKSEIYLAQTYVLNGDLVQAQRTALVAINLAEKAGDTSLEIKSMIVIGNIYHIQKNWEPAEKYFKKALDQAKRFEDEENISLVSFNLGLISVGKDRYTEAIDYFEPARIIAEKLGNKRRLSQALAGLGLAYFEIGKTELAIDNSKKSIEIFDEVNDQVRLICPLFFI